MNKKIEKMEKINQEKMAQGGQEELKCNCNDEYKTHPCPVHFGQSNNGDLVVITDANMAQEEIRQWVGFAYKCPKCNETSILDFMKFCGNCGVEVSLQSVKLTNFINELSKRGKYK